MTIQTGVAIGYNWPMPTARRLLKEIVPPGVAKFVRHGLMRRPVPPSVPGIVWREMDAIRDYVGANGWLDSRASGMPVDASGAPIPWFTYSSISFLESRIKPEMSVFEYGGGNSTHWWAARVRTVTTCEHDTEWCDKIKSSLPANVNLLYRKRGDGAYAGEICKHVSAFDIVVNDGRDRVQCAKNCLTSLRAAGIIVWDNSDRPEYESGYSFLIDNGFKRLDFFGAGPVNAYPWCTSFFYRADNCLGL